MRGARGGGVLAGSAVRLNRVSELVEGRLCGNVLPVVLRGTNFKIKVWEALRRLPVGSAAAYTDLAVAVGCPQGARAVGQAGGRNRLALLIPCHRVICETGEVGGYRWGGKRKEKVGIIGGVGGGGASPKAGEEPEGNQVLRVFCWFLSAVAFRAGQGAPVQARADGAAQVAGLHSADRLTPGHPIAGGDGW